VRLAALNLEGISGGGSELDLGIPGFRVFSLKFTCFSLSTECHLFRVNCVVFMFLRAHRNSWVSLILFREYFLRKFSHFNDLGGKR